jgi:hypothetical protein
MQEKKIPFGKAYEKFLLEVYHMITKSRKDNTQVMTSINPQVNAI